MTPAEWAEIQHFSPDEEWGDAARMDAGLIRSLDRFRAWVGLPMVIHCGCEQRPTGGWHPHGRAVDLHIKGLHPMEQFIAAARFNAFSGIGVYLWWHRPGLHLDNRPLDIFSPRRIWGSTAPGVYVPINAGFIRLAADLPWPPVANGAQV
jgi:hypothetical protein